MFFKALAPSLYTLIFLAFAYSLEFTDATQDGSRTQRRLSETSSMIFPFIASSPTPLKYSELYKLMEQLDILEVKNERIFYLVISSETLSEYRRFIPEVTLEKERTASLYEIHPSYKSTYGATNNYPTISKEFSCYRNLEGSYQTMVGLETQYPSLAEVIKIGSSYRQSIGEVGFDIQVLKLTNSNNSVANKSHLFITCALHVRELATAEACARFAESVLSLYGSDADMTWILDYTEIHMVMQSNPDGRKDEEFFVGLGDRYYRRKNMHFDPENNSCSSASGGVDLNRNFPHPAWGTAGVSNDRCYQTYPGLSKGSEPEVDAIVTYVESVLPPGTNTIDKNGAYSIDSTGVFMDIHSFGEDFFYPWGYKDASPKNQESLVAMAKKLASYTSPKHSTDNEVYATSGDSTDWVYESIGAAAYTMELGNDFYQDCSYFEEYVAPSALGALLYAARVSKAPYLYSKGPDVMRITLTSDTADTADTLKVVVKVSDSVRADGYRTGSQVISEISLYVNTHPYSISSSTTPESVVNSGFTSSTETATLSVNVTDLADGDHTIFVQAMDTDGVVGPVYASFFTVPLDYDSQLPPDDKDDFVAFDDVSSYNDAYYFYDDDESGNQDCSPFAIFLNYFR